MADKFPDLKRENKLPCLTGSTKADSAFNLNPPRSMLDMILFMVLKIED